MRPLSPHLQVYRPQITSVLSILHRFTGIGLSVSLVFLLIWLGSLVDGESAYTKTFQFFTSFFGQICLFSIVFSFYYHLLNGIRHLFWDMGLGFNKETVQKTGWSVVAGSAALTALTWVIGSL